jgi:hypothetical protein
MPETGQGFRSASAPGFGEPAPGLDPGLRRTVRRRKGVEYVVRSTGGYQLYATALFCAIGFVPFVWFSDDKVTLSTYVVGVGVLILVVLFAWRLLGRRCVVFADGRWKVRGFWCTVMIERNAGRSVEFAPYDAAGRSWDGSRVYVLATGPGGENFAFCVATGFKVSRFEQEQKVERLRSIQTNCGLPELEGPRPNVTDNMTPRGQWRLPLRRLRSLRRSEQS